MGRAEGGRKKIRNSTQKIAFTSMRICEGDFVIPIKMSNVIPYNLLSGYTCNVYENIHSIWNRKKLWVSIGKRND